MDDENESSIVLGFNPEIWSNSYIEFQSSPGILYIVLIFFEISKLIIKECKLHVLFDVDCSIAFFVHNFNKVIDIVCG